MISKEAQEFIDSFPNKREHVSDDSMQSIEADRSMWEDLIRYTPDTRLEYTSILLDNTEIEVISDGTQCSTCILYFHGGGFISGSLKTHRQFCSDLALRCGLEVWNVGYTLAPEGRYPLQLEEVKKAVKYAYEKKYQIITGGDSAGGGLALKAALELVNRYNTKPKALFMLSPWLDLTLSGGNLDSLDSIDPHIYKEGLERCTRLYCDREQLTEASPLFDDIKKTFPVYIDVGTSEVLLDDSRRMAKKWQDLRGDIQIVEREGMWHNYQLWYSNIPESNQALDELTGFLMKVK